MLGKEGRYGFALACVVSLSVCLAIGASDPNTPSWLLFMCVHHVPIFKYIGYMLLILQIRMSPLFLTTGKSRATEFKDAEYLVCSPVELINSFLHWKVAQSSRAAVSYCVKLLLVFGFQAELLLSY